MGNNAFDDLKKRAREDAYADIRQWMFWLPLTPNELTILGAIYAVQIENEDWGDEFALMEERWCSGFPYFRECLAKLLTKGHDHLLTRGLLLSHCFCGFGSVPLLLIMALPPVKSTFPATPEPQIVLRLPCDEV